MCEVGNDVQRVVRESSYCGIVKVLFPVKVSRDPITQGKFLALASNDSLDTFTKPHHITH